MKLTRKQRLLLRKKRISRARHKRRKLQRLKDNIELYRNDPAKFAEDVLGVELKGWQKALLSLDKFPILMTLPRKHGYKTYVDIMSSLNKLIKRGDV